MRGPIKSIEYHEISNSYSWESKWSPVMTFTINANGHARWVKSENLVM